MPTPIEDLWNQYVDEVRERAGDWLSSEVRRSGQKGSSAGRSTWKCCSPLRQEKTPSFYLYEAQERWYDYGTSKGGDAFAYVQERDNCSFREAVDTLAREVGATDWETRKKNLRGELKEEVLAELEKKRAEKTLVFGALTAIINLCATLLPERARNHLVNHYGLPEIFLAEERIGWAPAGLWEYAKEDLPYDDATLLATGMFHRTRSGSTYPSFNGRLVFPYFKDGLCVYAIGRQYHFGVPESEVTIPEWDKSKYRKLATHDPVLRPYISPHIQNDHFWGEDSLRRLGGETLFVTEGITDAHLLKVCGMRVISPVTVRFRAADGPRAVKLFRSAKEVIIVNDEDTTPDGKHPGLDGAEDIAAILVRDGIPVRLGRLPNPNGLAKIDVNEWLRDIRREAVKNGRDPDEEGRTAIADVATKALPFAPFLVSRLAKDASDTDLEAAIGRLGDAGVGLTPLERDRIEQDLTAKLCPPRKKKTVVAAFAAALREASKKNPAPAQTKEAGGGDDDAPRDRPLGSRVFEDIGCYEAEDAKGSRRRIANFSLTLRKIICPAQERHKLLVVDVVHESAELLGSWEIPPEAWIARKEFIKRFPHERMVWWGSDDDVQSVKAVVLSNYPDAPHITTTSAYGRHEVADKGPRYVLPAGVLSPDGWMEQPDIVHRDEGNSNLSQRLPSKPSDLGDATRDLVKRWFALLPPVHDARAIPLIAAWCMGAFIKPCIERRWGAFPILNVAATPHTGKSSLFEHVIWPSFAGVAVSKPMSCDDTNFANIKDFSSSVGPFLWLDEYKYDLPKKKRQELHRMLRRVYTGESSTRGRADQKVNIYFLGSPLVVSGEMRLDEEQALVERCIFVGMDVKWTELHRASVDAFEALKGEKLWQIAPWLARWTLRADLEPWFAAVEHAMRGLAREVPERTRRNWQALLMGQAMLVSLGRELEVPWPFDDFTATLALCRDGETEDTTEVPRQTLYQWIEEAARAAHLGILQDGTHFVCVEDKVCLWVDGIVPTLEAWQRQRGNENGFFGAREIRRLGREAVKASDKWVMEVGRLTRFPNGSHHRCIALRVDTLPPTFQFPGCIRTHGGLRTMQEVLQTASHRQGIDDLLS
jgi:hypothetical protein